MNYLSDQKVNLLIREIKSGNNDAWEQIYHNYENFILKRCEDKLTKFYMPDAKRKELKEDLYMAGWQGFVDSLKRYDPEKGKFLTYATYYIDGEISKELDFLL